MTLGGREVNGAKVPRVQAVRSLQDFLRLPQIPKVSQYLGPQGCTAYMPTGPRIEHGKIRERPPRPKLLLAPVRVT